MVVSNVINVTVVSTIALNNTGYLVITLTYYIIAQQESAFYHCMTQPPCLVIDYVIVHLSQYVM